MKKFKQKMIKIQTGRTVDLDGHIVLEEGWLSQPKYIVHLEKSSYAMSVSVSALHFQNDKHSSTKQMC